MDAIFEALVKLVPCSAWFETLGMGKQVAVGLAAVLHALMIYLLIKAADYFINRYKDSKAASSLAPWFEYPKVRTLREMFIPTKFQNNSPTREDEPAFSHKFVAKNLLIPFFMKTVFNEKKENDKYYLVLADSGMGKTTFMINLYLRYTSFYNFGRKYKMRLLPFGDSRILDKIKEIEKKDVPDTILLLDAFDEDKHLLPPQMPDGKDDDDRFRCRLDDIIEAVRDFREVIITSRTQYFPGQEDQPYELKIPRFNDNGFHKLAKFYLSPFNDKEIRGYLNRKYGIVRFWNWKKKGDALSIIRSAPKLMVRPMLLGYIDLLVGSNRSYKNTFEIYATLIKKWIEREADKRKHKIEDREKFKRDLLAYSQLVAQAIYQQRKQMDMLFLKRQDAVMVAKENNLNLQDYEITGQSLLTRDSAGNWKFAHKSILEYFIAKEALQNFSFLREVDFTGMDVAKHFYNESPAAFIKIKAGKFLMGSPPGEAERFLNEMQHEVEVSEFFIMKYPVTVKQFEKFVNRTNYSTDDTWRYTTNGKDKNDKRHPVINVSWNDAKAYCDWLAKEHNASFRLPTEAEWEYACRAGTTTPFSKGNNLTTDQANYNGNYPYGKNRKGKYIATTTPVGSYPSNPWGLYDMHGNVWEWCEDWYDENYFEQCKADGIVFNPIGPKSGSGRVLRGGSWINDARSCRCASRYGYDPGDRGNGVGFRVVFVP